MSDALTESTELDRQSLRRMLSAILAPEKQRLGLALLLATLNVALFILQSAILAHLIGTALTNWNAPEATRLGINLFNYLPWLLLCLVLRPLLHYGREHLSQTASHRARLQVRKQLLKTVASLGPERQQLGADGALSAKLLEQVDALDGYISRYYVQLYLVLLTPMLLLVATAYYSWLAAALLLLTAPLVPLFMILVGGAAAKSSQQQLAAMSHLSSRFLDLARGMPTLQHLAATTQAQRSIATAAEQYRIKTMGVLKLAFLSGAVLELFSALAVALVAVYLGMGLLGMLPWAKGEVPVAYTGALFILLLAPEFYAPLRQLGSDYHAKAEAEAAVGELYPLLNQQVWQHPGRQPLPLAAAPALTVEQLSISGAQQRQRLASVSFTLQAGERVLLQGASGLGKSSLLLAIMGFIPYQGRILLNQQDLLDFQRSDWQQRIAYLSQQPQFKQGTVAENLRLAAPAASDAKLWQVLEQVQLKALFLALPEQLTTRIGEAGLGLSGGQLGRLAIAQLLLREPVLWLLDEPTAHLDPETQSQINQLLQQVTKGHTVLLVSHSAEGLAWMDRQLTLEQLLASQAAADIGQEERQL